MFVERKGALACLIKRRWEATGGGTDKDGIYLLSVKLTKHALVPSSLCETPAMPQ
jgi:hypothetical protein